MAPSTSPIRSPCLAVSQNYGLPVFMVVLDNTGWGAVKEATLRVYPAGEAKAGSDYGANFGMNMDFGKIAGRRPPMASSCPRLRMSTARLRAASRRCAPVARRCCMRR